MYAYSCGFNLNIKFGAAAAAAAPFIQLAIQS